MEVEVVRGIVVLKELEVLVVVEQAQEVEQVEQEQLILVEVAVEQVDQRVQVLLVQ